MEDLFPVAPALHITPVCLKLRHCQFILAAGFETHLQGTPRQVPKILTKDMTMKLEDQMTTKIKRRMRKWLMMILMMKLSQKRQNLAEVRSPRFSLKSSPKVTSAFQSLISDLDSLTLESNQHNPLLILLSFFFFYFQHVFGFTHTHLPHLPIDCGDN